VSGNAWQKSCLMPCTQFLKFAYFRSLLFLLLILEQAQLKIKEMGEILENNEGKKYKNPYIEIANDAYRLTCESV